MAQEIKKGETKSAPQYLDPFNTMRTEMDRLFDRFLGQGTARPAFPSWPFASDKHVPSIDVRESDDSFFVEAELPGLAENDVSLTLNNGILTLKGEKRSEQNSTDKGYHLMERSYGSFVRSFDLGDAIDDDKVQATFDKGVLKVLLPKRAEAVRSERQIPIGRT
jgi:HSP20 family protein